MTLDITIQQDLQKLQRDLSVLEHRVEALFKARKNDEIMQQVARDKFTAEFSRNLKFYVKRMQKR